jgi:glycosyltransferase involved in cell wall biosynthesis
MGTTGAESPPLVSVVTPFHNTAAYLEECIESVLAQTMRDFEYLLVNNQSTDGSRDIAARYAARDPRIRLIDNPAFVGQVENYNGAVKHMHRGCKYLKMVQADDALFPGCLQAMVEVALRDPKIGLVGSFYLKGNSPFGAGIPRRDWRVPGREVCRQMLRGGYFPVGSPSVVLYRADIVRSRKPFYALGRFHEDTEAAYEILLEHDFGFVHQVLSFVRTDNLSIMSAARAFNPIPLDHVIVLERFGRKVMSEEEFEAVNSKAWRVYLGFLGLSLLQGRDERFWKYHRDGLATIGRSLTRAELLPYAAREVAEMAFNPLRTVERGVANIKRRLSSG